jgi:hypothetical protein
VSSHYDESQCDEKVKSKRYIIYFKFEKVEVEKVSYPIVERAYTDRDMKLKSDCKGSSGFEQIEIGSLKTSKENSGFEVIGIGI